MEDKQKGSKFSPLIFIGIIALILILLFAIPLSIYFFKSKSQCGSGGILIGNSKEGYYCGYNSVCEGCQNVSQCPDSFQFCESKGKVKRDGFCGPTKIDLTDKIKRDKEGNIYIAQGPVTCYSCCDEKE